MKYIIIVGDGMADNPIERLKNKTPLQFAHTPYMDLLAEKGQNGLLKTVPDGFLSGSEIANMSILGYDISKVYEGRAAFEAASIGVDILPDELCLRCNIVSVNKNMLIDYSANNISNNEACDIISFLNKNIDNNIFSFHAGLSYRNLLKMKKGNKDILCTPPHDIINKKFTSYLIKPNSKNSQDTAQKLNELIFKSQNLLENYYINRTRISKGLFPANSIWLWSPGYKPKMNYLSDMYPIKKGSVISAVDIIKGIGIYAGFEVINVEGATGFCDTNYEGKAQAAIDALKYNDFVYLHVEAPDEAGHRGDVDLKIKTIEYLDERVVKKIYEATQKMSENVVISLLPDHPTPCEMKTHTLDPVPFIIYHKEIYPDKVKLYNEFAAKDGCFGLLKENEFMNIIFKQ